MAVDNAWWINEARESASSECDGCKMECCMERIDDMIWNAEEYFRRMA